MTVIAEKTEHKAGYKKTELGLIPEEWSFTKLKNIAEIKSGSTPLRAMNDRYYKNGTIHWVKTLDLNNSEITATQEKITELALKESSCQIIPKDTVLVAMYGGFNQIGRTGIMTIDAAINQALSAIIADQGKVYPKYLLHWLNANVELWKNYAASSRKDPNITKKDVESFPIILPSLQEQHRLAEIFSYWDKAIEKTENLINAKTQLKKALMQKLLTGKVRFGEFAGQKWKKLKASEIFKNYSDKNHPDEELLSATQERGVIPRSMLEGRVMMPDGEVTSYKLVDKGDFVISLRSFQGGIEYSNYRGIVSPAYTVLKNIIPIDYGYYKHYFKSANFISRLAVTVIGIRDGKQISYGNFAELKLHYPPIEEQQKIADVLDTCDREIELLNKQLDSLKEQKKGLMQKLLTGQIRVKTA